MPDDRWIEDLVETLVKTPLPGDRVVVKGDRDRRELRVWADDVLDSAPLDGRRPDRRR